METTEADRAAIEELARLRWGPTGWRCPRCGGTRAWQLRCRPRVRQCAGCGAQRSVTGQTLLHGTRLPLHRFLATLVLERPTFDSVRTTMRSLGCAQSSAWHAVQRRLRLWAGAYDDASPADGVALHQQELPVVCTRGPLADPAPADIRSIHLHQDRGWLFVTTDAVGEHSRLHRVAATKVVPPGHRVRGRYEHPVIGLDRWLSSALRWERIVSVRWFPRWIGCFLTQWSVYATPGRTPTRDEWLRRAVALPRCPLRRLDPWWDRVGTA